MTDEITLDAPETRIERFLAAAAGVEGITLDEPETRIERYLYKIAQGSGGVPAVEDADKGKYLHANESTGDLEWASGGGSGGGGRFFVTLSYDEGTETWSADKTIEEISAAWVAGQNIFSLFDGGYTPPSTINVEDGAVTWIEFATVDIEAMLVNGGFGINADGVHYYSA